MQGAQERWIQWWCAPWEWAHPDWRSRLAERHGLTLHDCDTLLGRHHALFFEHVGIAPSQPPEPVPQLMQWLALDTAQQGQALALAERICLGGAAAPVLDAAVLAHEPWCRAVAKALRPGAWLHPEAADGRRLLAAWAGESCWSRLRLQWTPGTLEAQFVEMPSNKLQTLWQSVLWRIATP
jgi:hypothetical protein